MKALPPHWMPRLLALLGFALSFGGLFPYFLEYLQVPNHDLLEWDMALHARDGVALWLQLQRLDLVSLLWSFINMSFWMPLHPVLLALVSVFAPFSLEAYVLVNYFTLSAGVAWAFYLIGRSGRFNPAQKGVFCLGILYYLFRQGNSLHFWVTHLNIMIESLGVGLTIAFMTSALLETTERESALYRRSSVIALSLLFFTKIQYAMFFAPVWLARHLWMERAYLFGAAGYFARAWMELRRRRVLFAVCALLFISGTGLVVSRQNPADGISCAVFAAVLAISFVRPARQEATPALRDLYRWVVIPFGWFYFFPVKNKVRHLLFNVQSYTSQETPGEKMTVLIRDLSEHFLTIPLWAGWAIVAFVVVGGMWVHSRRARMDRIHAPYAIALLAAFYIPMSLAVGVRLARFSATWVAAVAVVALLTLISMVHRRGALGAIAVAFAVGGFVELRAQDRAAFREYMTTKAFLQPHDRNLREVLDTFDFGEPGVIYGLGSTMDLATILFELRILQRHPEYTSVFSKREERALIANDFGRERNADPAAEILRRARDPSLRQIVLYPTGFERQAFEILLHALKAPPLGFTARFETPEVVFLQRPPTAATDRK